MIELKNLYKTYHLKSKDVLAVQNVSLTIEDGEIFGIIGYSGAGKSSLIRCINLLETPDRGEIIVDGVVLAKDKDRIKNKELRRVRKGIGMIFQHFNLLDRSTVFENVAYALKYCKKSKEEIHKRVFELLDLVDLVDKADVYPSQLSGGQKQRVAIARALANNPSVLLSDEATSALDPDATESILALLKKLNRQLGLTIVLITHEMAVIKAICSKVAVMENGEIVEEGDVYSLFAHPRMPITKKFIESTSSLSKINILLEENSLDLENSGKVFKLQFEKDSVGNALISDISRRFNVDVNIMLANVEILQDAPLGAVIVEISGKEQDILDSIEYIKENKVRVTEIEKGGRTI